jgi:hypothetical protein
MDLLGQLDDTRETPISPHQPESSISPPLPFQIRKEKATMLDRPFQLAGDGLSHSTPRAHQAVFRPSPISPPQTLQKWKHSLHTPTPVFVTLPVSCARRMHAPHVIAHPHVAEIRNEPTLDRIESALLGASTLLFFVQFHVVGREIFRRSSAAYAGWSSTVSLVAGHPSCGPLAQVRPQSPYYCTF